MNKAERFFDPLSDTMFTDFTETDRIRALRQLPGLQNVSAAFGEGGRAFVKGSQNPALEDGLHNMEDLKQLLRAPPPKIRNALVYYGEGNKVPTPPEEAPFVQEWAPRPRPKSKWADRYPKYMTNAERFARESQALIEMGRQGLEPGTKIKFNRPLTERAKSEGGPWARVEVENVGDTLKPEGYIVVRGHPEKPVMRMPAMKLVKHLQWLNPLK